MKKFKYYISFITILLAIVLSACSATEENTIADMINQTASSMQQLTGKNNILSQQELLPAGNSAGDWTAMTLAFSDVDDDFDDYLLRLQQYVVQQYDEEGYLHRIKATEYHRIALTMLALGADPSAVEYNGGYINLIADGTYKFHAGSPDQQGSNGLIYALLSLDAMDYVIPSDAAYTREMLVEELLTYQTDKGGFGLDKSLGGDIDITAMAVQSLANYYEQDNVKIAVDKALLWLSQQMNDNGTFVSYGAQNTESGAQVILALCAMGIDPCESEMFTKSGVTVLDGMNSFRTKYGLYKHTADDAEYNHMSTYQALLALEAVEKLQTNSGWIFDFSGYVAPQNR